MTRRDFGHTLLGAAALAGGRLQASAAEQPVKYTADWDSLRRHTVPAWYDGAKFGIFIHWGLYSVPAWAVTNNEPGNSDPARWFTENPYAEWYLNTLRIAGSPTEKHHFETYGKNFDYYDFTPMFNQATAKWKPDAWSSLFQKAGARYVVLTTKHHDGFRLWPSKVVNPKRPTPNLSAKRDLVGDLTASVRQHGMKMGLYYSGGLDWTFTTEPIRTMDDLKKRVPQSEAYARYADAHWTELTDRYQPALMWNDISYPKAGNIPGIFAHYYNSVSEGVINNRFDVDFADFTTPEYSKYDKITEKKWESCRGLGFSFGYNQLEGPEQVIASDKLIALLVDIVSKNGNLLLNIGPRPDGIISDIQMDRLTKLGAWLDVNGEGIFDSKPWVRASASDAGAPDVRFTHKGDSVYAFLLDPPSGGKLTVPGVLAADNSRMRVLGAASDSDWKQVGRNVEVSAPAGLKSGTAVAVRITPAPWQIVRA